MDAVCTVKARMLSQCLRELRAQLPFAERRERSRCRRRRSSQRHVGGHAAAARPLPRAQMIQITPATNTAAGTISTARAKDSGLPGARPR